ncbi:uncharacterized protein EI90DRAFT_2951567 [Cantharellus anzutake]|uniref:uncharacterized protein n=1 Tax=Cantharellus anzutake TaxID=1750568 RepID=UPI001908B96A|nr:uncharacterized protein EI90DRAFT_2951567 [Cantharellus anzutake]KAF8312431.1 hypothetical protein EI90DRAFT_2951567 [Cantharellus anzutake]
MRKETQQIDLAYAFTDYWAQRQMIKYLWADIGTPPRGALTPFNAYVTLSHARGRANIHLICDFKDLLFTTTPCEVLEEEDKQLEWLNRKTKVEWERKRSGE